jgi:hypothetical protein
MAVRLVHETTHARNPFPAGSGNLEEGLAWDRAMRVYERLRTGPHGQSQFYEKYYQSRCAQGIGTTICGP